MDIPGIFNKFEDISGFRNDARSVFMDGVHSMFPDGVRLKRNAAENIEYMSKSLSYSKVEKISDYNIEIINHLNVTCGNTIVTNVAPINPDKVWIVERMALLFDYVIFDKKRIYETLYRLNKKDYFNYVMSERDFLELCYCISLAKEPYAKDVIEKSARLFTTIEKIRNQHQLDLHFTLKVKIKYHFRDDLKKQKELLTMITKALPMVNVDNLNNYEVDIYELNVKNSYLEDKNSQLVDELSQLKDSYPKLLDEIAFLKDELSVKY